MFFFSIPYKRVFEHSLIQREQKGEVGWERIRHSLRHFFLWDALSYDQSVVKF